MDFKDYYKVLGVAKDASEEDIRKAYRKLARKYHPDVSKEKDADQRMRDINEASEVLRDKEKRAAYDQLAAHVARGGNPDGSFTPPPNWDQGFDFQRGARTGTADSADFSDFFSSLFGSAERRSAERRHYRARGEDQHTDIEISLHDALHGAEREINLRAQTVDEQGQASVKTRTLQVKIPAGVRPGQFIRLAGQGSPGYGGEAAGDLYLKVSIAADARWRVHGADLYMDLPITPTEAALGAQVEVPTPQGGRVEVRVPAGSKPGGKLRLKERGLPGKTPGDLYLILDIALPPADTDAVRQAYEQLAKAAPFDPRPHLAA